VRAYFLYGKDPNPNVFRLGKRRAENLRKALGSEEALKEYKPPSARGQEAFIDLLSTSG
jgi:hypothetical protein